MRDHDPARLFAIERHQTALGRLQVIGVGGGLDLLGRLAQLECMRPLALDLQELQVTVDPVVKRTHHARVREPT